MKILFFLHFYQPYDQQHDILDRIVNESYRPLVRGLLSRPRAKIVVNITGSLIQLLQDFDYVDVLEDLKTLLARGQIEITGTCMYHAFLPLIPETEARRQIMLNEDITFRALGITKKPLGFFSPEMAVSRQVRKVAVELGYKWLAVPQLASINGNYNPTKTYYDDEFSDLNIFFRDKRVSSLILSSVVRDSASLIQETVDLQKSDKYWFCVMDAETFGHHRIGHEKVLFQILDDPFFDSVTAEDLLNQFSNTKESVLLRDCTWTNSEQDLHLTGEQNSFILWKDPENPIHKLQWDFSDFVINLVNGYPDKSVPQYLAARGLLDKAIASDQFWWASVKPWWSLEMIEQGGHALLEVVRTLYPKEDNSAYVEKAENYYRSILDKAFAWQRSGLIREKHIQNSATYMSKPFQDRTPIEWYNQIILEFEDEMNKAASNREYEKAIKWRDAIIKLDQKSDIYDVLHVVDELWSARQIPSVKPFLDHSWDELSDFAKKYLKNVMSAEDLDRWKKERTN